MFRKKESKGPIIFLFKSTTNHPFISKGAELGTVFLGIHSYWKVNVNLEQTLASHMNLVLKECGICSQRVKFPSLA